MGNVITLCIEKRGVQTNMVYHGKQVALTYEIPMAEVVLDFFDRLKSTSARLCVLCWTATTSNALRDLRHGPSGHHDQR